mgnify:CR=1 FL=1
MHMETRNSKTEMPLFKVKGEKFIFAVQMKLQGKCRVVGENRMEKIKLTDICNPKQWKTIPTSELLEDGYPVYGANGIIGYYSEFNHKNPVITVTCRGATCGTINITVPKSYVTGNAMCLDDVRSDIYMEYLYYCLKHYNFNNVISGSAQPQITRQGMEKIYVTIGSHNEQMDIVDKLKKVENVIGLKKQELKQLDTFVKSRFVELFGDPIKNPKGWEVVKLSECLERIDNGKSFTCDSNAREGVFPAILKLSAATYGDYRPYENKALLDEKQFVESVEVHRGDLLFTRKNTPDLVGMAAYVFETPEKLMMPDLIFRLVTNERMTPTFLWQLINNREFRPAIQGISGGSAKSMSNISKERLKNIEVICPPISEQKKLEGVLEQVDKSKSKIQKSLEETQLLFDSLMQKYFG